MPTHLTDDQADDLDRALGLGEPRMPDGPTPPPQPLGPCTHTAAEERAASRCTPCLITERDEARAEAAQARAEADVLREALELELSGCQGWLRDKRSQPYGQGTDEWWEIVHRLVGITDRLKQALTAAPRAAARARREAALREAVAELDASLLPNTGQHSDDCTAQYGACIVDPEQCGACITRMMVWSLRSLLGEPGGGGGERGSGHKVHHHCGWCGEVTIHECYADVPEGARAE